MFTVLPESVGEDATLSWPRVLLHYRELDASSLSASNVEEWLARWSRLCGYVDEMQKRLHVATWLDTNDEGATKQLHLFLQDFLPTSQKADQELKIKLLNSGLRPQGFVVPMLKMEVEVELFNEENLRLQMAEKDILSEYDRIMSAQTVEWEGEEVHIVQLLPVYRDADRQKRERAWRLVMDRQLEDRDAIDALWIRLVALRQRIAANAGYNNYQDYRWRQLFRFDYTPEDCAGFHKAIEEVVVPAVARLFEERRLQLGVTALRPWDLYVDPLDRAPLRPYSSIAELEQKAGECFGRVHPVFGEYFQVMRDARLLDLENRKGKAPGGYSKVFARQRRPFILMNVVGLHDDVLTLFHYAGHAFHAFEASRLPYYHQREVGFEFAEVASMSMELLASQHTWHGQSGFYSEVEAGQGMERLLEVVLQALAGVAPVDAFQQWAYQHPDLAAGPAYCDAKWAELWRRFMPVVDWSGLEGELATRWQRTAHIFKQPFHYIEYGVARLGAVQVWRNALTDWAGAMARYQQALSLGGTVSIPQLFETAGTAFAFDAHTLHVVVDFVEAELHKIKQKNKGVP